MAKPRILPAAAFGIASNGISSALGGELEPSPGSSRRQFERSDARLGEWLHLRVPDPLGGAGRELFVNLAKRVTYVCPGSGTRGRGRP